MREPGSEKRPHEELQPELGLGSATAIVIGEVIGISIFLTPAGMAKSLGSPLWLMIVWLAMGAMALSGALCYGRLAAQFPYTGGDYVYLRETYGRMVAFLYGWKSLLVMDPGITAALAVGMASYVGSIIRLTPLGNKIVAIVTIFALAAANIVGVRVGASVLRWLTLLKLGLLALIVVWGFGQQLGDWSNFLPLIERRSSVPYFEALASSMVAGFFSFGGWWDVNKIAGEVRNPTRTLPRAMALGVITATLVYLLISAVFIYLVPLDRVTSSETFAAQVGEAMFGQVGGQVFSGIVIISILGNLAALMLNAPRVYYVMARDGLFLPAAAALHSRFGTPARTIALQAGLASLLVVFGSFNQIIAYFIFVTVLFIALTAASVFLLPSNQPSMLRVGQFNFWFAPLFFLALVGLLLILLISQNPKQALLGTGVTMIGVPVYYLLFRRREVSRG
jgi:APA family basic amino acid/polyamine antiporter